MRAVKQKVWNEAEARAVRARKTLTPRFTDFFTGFEEKSTVLHSTASKIISLIKTFEISRIIACGDTIWLSSSVARSLREQWRSSSNSRSLVD